MITVDISGFGGGYEIACQLMLAQGVQWLESHPEANPRFKRYEGVFGLAIEDNTDAKDLSTAILFEVPGGPSGAMHDAATWHAMRVAKLGREQWLKDGLAKNQLIRVPFETIDEMRKWLVETKHDYKTAQQWEKVTSLEGAII